VKKNPFHRIDKLTEIVNEKLRAGGLCQEDTIELNNIALFAHFERDLMSKAKTKKKGYRLEASQKVVEIIKEKKRLESKQFGKVWKGVYYRRKLMKNAEHLYRTGKLLSWNQGKGGKHASLIDREDVKKEVLTWAKSLGVGKVRFKAARIRS
jgi:hypothetical protein